MKKAFKIFSIMFVIEIVLIAILDSMARKMYVNTKSYDIKNDNQRVLFH